MRKYICEGTKRVGHRPWKQNKRSEDKRESKNPMWHGDKAEPHAGRLRAIRKFPCPKGLERHHKDGNSLNNKSENIEFVTRKQHMIIDGRMKKRDEKGRFCK